MIKQLHMKNCKAFFMYLTQSVQTPMYLQEKLVNNCFHVIEHEITAA